MTTLKQPRPHLYCGVFRGGHHDAEHRVEDDPGDGAAVAAEGVLLWRARDPLFGVPFLSDRTAQGDLLLGLVQLGLQLHHLRPHTQHVSTVTPLGSFDSTR